MCENIWTTFLPTPHSIVFASLGWKIFHYSFNFHFFYCQWCWACFNDLKGSLHYFSVNCIIPLFLVLLGYSFLVVYINKSCFFILCVVHIFPVCGPFLKVLFYCAQFLSIFACLLFFVLCLERLSLLRFVFVFFSILLCVALELIWF